MRTGVAPRDRFDPDVAVAVMVGAVGDPLAVGRPVGVLFAHRQGREFTDRNVAGDVEVRRGPVDRFGLGRPGSAQKLDDAAAFDSLA